MPDHTKIPIEFNPLSQRMTGMTMHGSIEFDVPFMTEIDTNLWQGGCKNGLILPTHINYIVSLYPWERYRIFHKTRGELYVRMYDSPEQSLSQVEDIAQQVFKWAQDGAVLVHCQAGLNRSSLVVARVLQLRGMSGASAINKIRQLRSPACLCNAAFESFILEHS